MLVANFGLAFKRNLGYSSHDIISTMFRVTKSMDTLSEHAKLEFIKVWGSHLFQFVFGLPEVLRAPTLLCTVV